MSAELNVAVIGGGNIGQHHARVYFEMQNVSLVAVCDKNAKVAHNIAEKYSCLPYRNHKKMIQECEIDAASLAVPTYLHKKVACEILDAGLHVLLEKPIATSLEDAKAIIKKARNKELILMVGHIERFNPAVKRLKELIDKGRLGEIISINIKRVGGIPPQTKGANVIMDLGIHDIDVSNYLVGKYPKAVHGYKTKGLLEKQYDSAVILLNYGRTFSFIEVNWITPVKIRTLDITGTKAFARLDYIHQTITLYENSYLNFDSIIYNNFNEFVSRFSLTDEIKIGVNKKEPLECEIESFVECIINNKAPIVSGEDGLQALKIALHI